MHFLSIHNDWTLQPLPSAAVIRLAESPVWTSRCYTLIPVGAVYFFVGAQCPRKCQLWGREGVVILGRLPLSPAVEHAVFLQTLLTLWAVGWDVLN